MAGAVKDPRVPPEFTPLPEFEAPKQETPELLPMARSYSQEHFNSLDLFHTGGGAVRPSDNFQGLMRYAASMSLGPDASLADIEDVAGAGMDQENQYHRDMRKMLGKTALYGAVTGGGIGLAAKSAKVARAAGRHAMAHPGAWTGFLAAAAGEIWLDFGLSDLLTGRFTRTEEERMNRLVDEFGQHVPAHLPRPRRDREAVHPQVADHALGEYYYNNDPNLRDRPEGQEWWRLEENMLERMTAERQQRAAEMGFTGPLANNTGYHQAMYGTDEWKPYDPNDPFSTVRETETAVQARQIEHLQSLGWGLGPPTKAFRQNLIDIHRAFRDEAPGTVDPSKPYSDRINMYNSAKIYTDTFAAATGREPTTTQDFGIPIEHLENQIIRNRNPQPSTRSVAFRGGNNPRFKDAQPPEVQQGYTERYQNQSENILSRSR